jgi:hypothetical protein
MVFTTYLTKKSDPQGASVFPPNVDVYMKYWYQGIDKGVIFHDELNDAFKQNYPKVTFVRVFDYPWSANDQRFSFYLDYILKHEELDDCWFTDLFDVTINHLPKIENNKVVYVSNEENYWCNSKWSRMQFKNANVTGERYEKLLNEEYDKRIIYNPGVWGCKRERAIFLLSSMVTMMEVLDVKERNCNMFVFNEVIHRLRDEDIITGYPLHSKFKAYEKDSKAYFVHK